MWEAGLTCIGTTHYAIMKYALHLYYEVRNLLDLLMDELQ